MKLFDLAFSNANVSSVTMWLEVTRVADFMTFIMSTFINGVLLNLISTASPKHFGNYVYLMMSFSINSLVFAAIHAFIQPIISTEKYVLFVFTSTNYLELPRIVMRFLLWKTLMVLVCLCWHFRAQLGIMRIFHRQGDTRSFRDFEGFSFSVILFCFCFIHYKMQRVTYSKIYETVQKQLFRALMSQMIIPLVLIYIPIIVVLILPIFHVKNSAAVSLTSILISFYPVLDPFAVIMIISVYRQGFFNMFTNKPKVNQIANLEMSG
ncbi:unnamed protein product [Caenorhabditis nigoni]